MIAVACGAFIYLSTAGILPSMEPGWLLFVWAVLLIAVGLAIAAFVNWLQKPLNSAWVAWRRRRAVKKAEQEFRDYMPYLSPKDRQILGYLRAKKMKTFVADDDAGYASTLLSRRFIYLCAVGGQRFDADKVSFAVHEHVWKVLEEMPDEFPHLPEYNGNVEVALAHSLDGSLMEGGHMFSAVQPTKGQRN
jgi:hypothetical protein